MQDRSLSQILYHVGCPYYSWKPVIHGITMMFGITTLFPPKNAMLTGPLKMSKLKRASILLFVVFVNYIFISIFNDGTISLFNMGKKRQNKV